MKSRAVSSFWKDYDALPAEIQRIAIKQYRLWLQDPSHGSVQFKKVQGYWSARVTDQYRALAIVDGDTVIWFWIGTHRNYERLIRNK